MRQKTEDAGARRVADPAPQPMHRDDISFRQLSPDRGFGDAGKIGLEKPRVGNFGVGAKRARGGDMGRIVIDADHLPGGVAGCEHQRTKALAATELQIRQLAGWADLDPGRPPQEAGKVEMERRLMTVIARQVGDVSDVAAAPITRDRGHPLARPASSSASRISASKIASSAFRRGMPGTSGSGAGIQVFQPRRGAGSASRSSRKIGTSGPARTGFTAKPVS